jgi:hypothetical protein
MLFFTSFAIPLFTMLLLVWVLAIWGVFNRAVHVHVARPIWLFTGAILLTLLTGLFFYAAWGAIPSSITSLGIDIAIVFAASSIVYSGATLAALLLEEAHSNAEDSKNNAAFLHHTIGFCVYWGIYARHTEQSSAADGGNRCQRKGQGHCWQAAHTPITSGTYSKNKTTSQEVG